MKFLLAVLLFAGLGAFGAYQAVIGTHGAVTGQLGLIDYRGEVTAENVMEIREADISDELPVAELPDGESHNFGVMKIGEKGKHLFTIRNAGTAPMTLRLGASTCKCTFGTLNSDLLAPGESTEVALEWTVNAASGFFEQTAEIITNDPSQVALRLKVYGDVVEQLRMIPKEISLGENAAGEPINAEAKCFSYFPTPIEPIDAKISGASLKDVHQITIEEFDPAEDSEYSNAEQAFRLKIHVDPNVRQGLISQNLMLRFHRRAEDGSYLMNESGEPEVYSVNYPVIGRITGALSMIPNPRLKGESGGGWVYQFGRLEPDDDFVGKALLTFKGAERENTQLSIGEVSPEGVLDATIEEQSSGGTMSLYKVTIRLTPGEESMLRMGKTPDDYGSLVINSDNPKVPPMRMLVKFGLPSRDRVAAASEAVEPSTDAGDNAE